MKKTKKVKIKTKTTLGPAKFTPKGTKKIKY